MIDLRKNVLLLLVALLILFLPLVVETIAQTFDPDEDDCLWLHRWDSSLSIGNYNKIMDPQDPGTLGYTDTQEITLSSNQIAYWFSPSVNEETTISEGT